MSGRLLRTSIRGTKSAIHSGLHLLMVFTILLTTVIPPHVAQAVEAEGQEPQAEPEKQETLAGIAPELKSLVDQVNEGRVKTADPNHLTEQELEIVDRPGVIRRGFHRITGRKPAEPRFISLLNTDINRPVIVINNFVEQVAVAFEPDTRKLVFSTHGGLYRHVRKNANVIGQPIKDPELVSVLTALEGTSDDRNRYQVDLVPVGEFTGNDQAKGLGFYAPVNFYPALTFSLPKGVVVEGLEYVGPETLNESIETLTEQGLPRYIKAGDLLVHVKMDGKSKKLWVSRDTLYLNLKNCIKFTSVLAFMRTPSTEAYAQLLAMFEGEEAELNRMVGDVQQAVGAEGTWMLDRAIGAQRLRDKTAWKLGHAAKIITEENGVRVTKPPVLDQLAKRPRQEFDLEDSDGEWEILRTRLKDAKEKEPGIKIDSTTPSYASVAIDKALEVEKQNQAHRWSFWRTFQVAKQKILTPGRVMALGLCLTVGAYNLSPENPAFEALTAVGSQIYDFASHAHEPGATVAQKAVHAAVSPIQNSSRFLADNYFLGEFQTTTRDGNIETMPGGLNTIGSWSASIGFYLAMLPLFYLVPWGYHKYVKREHVNRNWWRAAQIAFTDMLHIFAWTNRALQEAFWKSPLVRQYNLYNALHANLDPLNVVKNGKAWNWPWASNEEIQARGEALSQSEDKSRQVSLIASRAVALAMVAKETGIDPATLEMSGSAKDMAQFLEKLVSDSEYAHQWVYASGELYKLLDAVANQLPDQVSLDPVETDRMVEEYLNQAASIVDTARTMDQREWIKSYCEKRDNPDACEGFSVTGFLANQFKRSAAAVSQYGLHAALFGMPGLEVFHKNRNMTVDMNATKMAGRMVGMDFPISTIALGAKSPEAYLWRESGIPFTDMAMPFPGETRIFASQTEQLLAWHMGSQVDAMSTALRSLKTNPYGPLAKFYFDSDIGAPYVREQTLDEGLAAILRGRMDPQSKSLVTYWKRYLFNVYNFIQAKMIVSGIPIAVGLWLGDQATRTDAMSSLPAGTPSWMVVPTAAFFMAAWLWLIKYTIVVGRTDNGISIVPNYAVLWSAVAATTNEATAPAEANRAAVMDAVGYLSSSDPNQYQEGARKLKGLFAKHRLPIPVEFNRPSREFDDTLRRGFLAFVMDKEHVPGPTKESEFLTIGLINGGLGALGTTAMYDSLSREMFGSGMDPITSAGQSLGWYAAAVAAAVAGGAAMKASAPMWRKPHEAVSATLSGVAHARDFVKKKCSDLVLGQDASLTYDIDLT